MAAGADPVDLHDAVPRWIEVRFEVSPRDLPAQASSVYTVPVPAWIEPIGDTGLRRVIVDREYVETTLMMDYRPVAGSFGDFVWTFDSVTGAVRNAELSGLVRVELDMGLFRSTVKAKIDTRMATDRIGGYRKPRSWLGQQLFHFCEEPDSRACTLVPATDYVPTSGYVNAVGALRVTFGQVHLRTFSPLGEAVFSEIDDPLLASAPRPDAAVRSEIGGGSEAGLAAIAAGPMPLH
jgi:hypothetical protein